MNDRSTVGIRIVPEFENTATSAGLEGYRAVKDGSSYSAAGSWWVDMVTFSARPIGMTNALPFITSIGDFQMTEEKVSGPIEFSISDAESSPDRLILNVSTSNPEVITNLTLAGTGTNRVLTLAPGKPGEASITITVTDEEGGSTGTSFTVEVLPKVNSEPRQTPFIYWNFNSPFADADATTGSFKDTGGLHELRIIGVATHTFGTVGQGESSDPVDTDNSMLRISGFPRQGTSNKTAGIEIRANTVGFKNLALVWDQYNSGTASRYYRIQYTTNGTDFVDHALTTNLTASSWARQRTVGFQNVPGTENNPRFAVRFVAEFGPDESYVAVGSGSNYGTTGTLWLDMIGFTGERLAIEAPQLSCSRAGNEIHLTWPQTARDFIIEFQEGVGLEWRHGDLPVEESEEQFKVKTRLEGARRFYRLRKNEGL